MARAIWSILLLAALAAAGPPARAQGCGPSQLGAPCGNGGPATLGSAAGPGLAVGNPVNVATGNKYQREADLPPASAPLALEVVRHYNSRDPRAGGFGLGWVLSYETRLLRAGGGVQIVQADGSRVDFSAADGVAACGADDPAHGELVPITVPGGPPRHDWRWPSGRVLHFDPDGRLAGITGEDGGRLRIERGRVPGTPAHREIVDVVDPDGRSLRVAWGEGPARRIAAIDTPVGRIAYGYDAAGRLAFARYPDGHARVYRYQLAGGQARLAGIAVQRPDGSRRELATWRHDDSGRVVGMQIPGEGGPRALAIAYGRDGAVVSDAAGAQTRFRTGVRGARHAVLAIEGAGCPGCAPPRGVVRHDAHGRAREGVERDRLGRPTAWGGKAGVRIDWVPGATLPARIERQSVVAGRRHAAEFAWRPLAVPGGEVMVPAELRESGWRPGAPGAPPASVARRLALDWTWDAGRVRLVAVHADGPVAVPRDPAPSELAAWPGLALVRDDLGHVARWRSAATGEEVREHDAAHRLVRRRFANGDVWRVRHDPAGRLASVRVSREGEAAADTWRVDRGPAGRPLRIANAAESVELAYDAAGRLVGRAVARAPVAGLDGVPTPALAFREAFERDAAGRVVRHTLPEGGALLYRWSDAEPRRLLALRWQDADGALHNLLDGTPHGFVHGNGVELRRALRGGRLAALAYERGGAPVFAQAFGYDEAGRIVSERHRHAGGAAAAARYGHDARGRLVVAEASGDTTFIAWQEDGTALAVQRGEARHTPRIVRDPSGLPRRVGGFALDYGPARRLRAVSQAGVVRARYGHNALGEQVWRADAAGVVHHLYLEQRLVAEARAGAGVTRRYVYAHGVPVAMIVYAEPQPLDGAGPRAAPRWRLTVGKRPRGAWFAVHADALGAPRVVTDAAGAVRWRADYDVLGRASMAGDLDLPLRLPGQVADPVTGWHDNYLRTYDPAFGHYLEPDPLGPPALAAERGWPAGVRPLTSPFGYAAQQPRRHADPLGLVLFAFDGTTEDLETRTNVYWMTRLYRNAADAAMGVPEYHYRHGVGSPAGPDWDAAVGHTADAILADQWAALLGHLAAYQAGTTAAEIDLVGYSRGAPLARHFANQLAAATRNGRFWTWDAARGAVTACVDLRFMGLFESVAMFGLLGADDHKYDFTIAPDWELVAHAVALHERRMLFPLHSAANADGSMPANVIELPFIGAHADIGGGTTRPGPGGVDLEDLSDITLAWMMRLARSVGLAFDPVPPEQREVTDPALHDMRFAIERRAQWAHERGRTVLGFELWPDRKVYAADGSTLATYQMTHEHYGNAERAVAEGFIHRMAGWMNSGEEIVGVVDLKAYDAWLARREARAGR